jgi:hypothetical protein
MRRPLPALLVVLASGLIAAPAAHANAFDTIFKTYQRTGKVDACKFSAADLNKALKQVPNDIEQYAPDFPAALQAAAEKRASGGCEKAAPDTTTGATAGAAPTATTGVPPGGASTGAAPAATAPPAAGTPSPTPSSAPAAGAADTAIDTAAKKDDGGSGLPAALVALAVLAGLLALGALAWALARWWAWDPPWLVRARHAGAEAGWRAGATWAEFTDWVRMGR